jgi:cobalamin biosynthesis protein CobD
VKQLIWWNIVALLIGVVMDLVVGDPERMIHMVQIFGLVIDALEAVLYRHRYHRVLCGTILMILTLLICTGVPLLLLWVLWKFHPLLYALWGGVLCWQCLAAKSLKDESDLVRVPLEQHDLATARKMVARIVGRDTNTLDEAGVTRAAVETVAENTSDGVIAPLFYLAVGGPVLGCFYKAANTMDSMIGYKNDKYIEFGRAAAKFDDVVNYLPARLAALELILAAKLCGMDAKNAWRIWQRDRRNHASPNSAQTESAVAGALGLQLAGPAYYFGKLLDKPYIGDPLREIEPEDIRRAQKLMFAAAGVMLALALAVLLAIYFRL